MARQGKQGFTLIELMIVVLVIALLAAIALSSYQKQIRKSRRAEARQAIAALALKQEKYRANNPTYGTVAQIGGAATTSYYTVVLTGTPTGTDYTFTATPIGDQLNDSCGTLSWAMASGTITKSPDPTNCW